MGEIEFIGKCLLVNEKGKRIVVIGDLHLGFEEGARRGGVSLPLGIYKKTIEELKEIFDRLDRERKRADIVVLIGDVKHEIGRILGGEWREVSGLFEFLRERIGEKGEIVVIKGNHDVMMSYIGEKRNFKLVDYFKFGGFCFLHGDRDFEEIYGKEIKSWVMGHFHPAVTLESGSKSEMFKCFLVGKYKGKRVVIVPSFFGVNEGMDLRENYYEGKIFGFKFKGFDVFAVNDNLEVLEFGKLGKL